MEDSTTETIRNSIDKRMEGDLGHAAELLSALWEIANSDDNTVNKVDDVETPSNTPPAVSYFRSCRALLGITRSAYFTSGSEHKFEGEEKAE